MKLNKNIFTAVLLGLLLNTQVAHAWSIKSWWNKLSSRQKTAALVVGGVGAVGTLLVGSVMALIVHSAYRVQALKKINTNIGSTIKNSDYKTMLGEFNNVPVFYERKLLVKKMVQKDYHDYLQKDKEAQSIVDQVYTAALREESSFISYKGSDQKTQLYWLEGKKFGNLLDDKRPKKESPVKKQFDLLCTYMDQDNFAKFEKYFSNIGYFYRQRLFDEYGNQLFSRVWEMKEGRGRYLAMLHVMHTVTEDKETGDIDKQYEHPISKNKWRVKLQVH